MTADALRQKAPETPERLSEGELAHCNALLSQPVIAFSDVAVLAGYMNRALTELRALRAAAEWRGNGAEVQSWSAGKNMSPRKEEHAEGEFEVRFTFNDVAAAKAWAIWALGEDRAPPLPIPPREG